ncbi:hypothetical protein RCL1_009075 [Eukaryota sp. TZLM3-RCL]
MSSAEAKNPSHYLTAQLRYKNDLPEVPTDPALLSYPFDLVPLVRERPDDVVSSVPFIPSIEPTDAVFPLAHLLLDISLRSKQFNKAQPASLEDLDLLNPLTDSFGNKPKTSEDFSHGYLKRSEYTSSTSSSRENRRPVRKAKQEQTLEELVDFQFSSAQILPTQPLSSLQHPKDSQATAVAITPLFLSSDFPSLFPSKPLSHVCIEEQMADEVELLVKPVLSADGVRQDVFGVYRRDQQVGVHVPCSTCAEGNVIAKGESLLVVCGDTSYLVDLDEEQYQLYKKRDLPPPSSVPSIVLE